MEVVHESFPQMEPKNLLEVINWAAFTEYHDDIGDESDDQGA